MAEKAELRVSGTVKVLEETGPWYYKPVSWCNLVANSESNSLRLPFDGSAMSKSFGIITPA